MEQVRQIPVPPEVLALSALPGVTYADAFLFDVGPPGARSAEAWAREIFGNAPMRASLLKGWARLGLRVDPDRPQPAVLGWAVRASTPDFVLLGAESRIGMPGELLLRRTGDELLFATFVQAGNVLTRLLWRCVTPMHVRVVRKILGGAGRRLRATEPSSEARLPG